jgi:hypothetical protein
MAMHTVVVLALDQVIPFDLATHSGFSDNGLERPSCAGDGDESLMAR